MPPCGAHLLTRRSCSSGGPMRLSRRRANRSAADLAGILSCPHHRAAGGSLRALASSFFGTRRALISGVSAVVALGVSAGCAFLLTAHSSPHHHAAATASPSPTHRHKGPLRSPFTGERIKHLRRELIFKIDNVEQARPPTGLTKADIVYILPVEGDLSRIMAVFSSHIPPIVGPVRSARQEDLKLLSQFGRPAFAYSGAQRFLLPYVQHAKTVDLYAGTVGGYFRDYRRIAPYNLYARTKVLLREARHASRARDIGFRFGPTQAGGKRIHSYRVSYPAAHFQFWWSHKQHRWLVSMDGKLARAHNGHLLGGRTVVVQYTKIRKSVFQEWGSLPPYAQTVGHGRVV